MKPIKPLGQKAYGHIAHLPGSRMGPGDHAVHEGQGRICTEKVRDKHDRVIVQEKLDGSCVSVARIGWEIVPLTRAGYSAKDSKYPQHHLFHDWIMEEVRRFYFLKEGERICGEWLAQAHGTRYKLFHEPFVAFDLMTGVERAPYDDFRERIGWQLPLPELLSDGPAFPIEAALRRLGTYGYHGSLDAVEGAVWRVERQGKVDFLAKYVRPDKVDGCYLPEISGKEAVWNWQPMPRA